MPTPEMSDITTHGIRVGATAYYLPEESEADDGRFFFGYRIVIHNTRDDTVQLLTRHWDIIDGDGDIKQVDGKGVVGEQPTLQPGQAFRYNSFCPLETSWGTMEGHYQFRAEDGKRFDVVIDRFYLTTEQILEPEAVGQAD